MELHHRVEVIDAILEEAEQKTTALQHALAAQGRAKEEMQHTGLTEVRTLLEDIEESERQRGLSQ